MPKTVTDPFAVAYIGLPPGHPFKMTCVDQHDLHVALEDVKDGPPVDTGALHGDMCTALLFEPIQEPEQIIGHGGEGADLLRTILDQACDDSPGMDIDAAAT